MAVFARERVGPEHHGGDRTAPGRRWKVAAVVVLVGVALWQLITQELAYYLALESPEMALLLDASQPLALTTLADRDLNGERGAENEAASEGTPEAGRDALGRWAATALRARTQDAPAPAKALSAADKARIRSMAERALIRDPLNARALRILGQLADADGDTAQAKKFMRAAARRSLRATFAVHWLMVESAKEHDYAATLRYADLLLRKRSQLGSVTFPLLGQIAEAQQDGDRAPLIAKLAEDPPWRTSFLAALPRHIKDARTPLTLLLALKDSPSPATDKEINGYLNFLVSKRLYEFAYYVWLQFLSPEALSGIGFLVNGGFEGQPTGAPFDWTISGGPGVTIDIAERTDAGGQRALYLEFGPGRASFGGVAQIVMLSPGTYRLSGRLQGEISGRRGLQWRVKCLGGGQLQAEAQMFVGSAPTWTAFETVFEIPAENCRAQELRLALAARSASEQLVSGSIWYDDLKLVRLVDQEQGRD